MQALGKGEIISLLKTPWEKREIAQDEHFLLFPQYFYTCLESFNAFSSKLKLLSAKSFSLGESKIGRLGKGY